MSEGWLSQIVSGYNRCGVSGAWAALVGDHGPTIPPPAEIVKKIDSDPTFQQIASGQIDHIVSDDRGGYRASEQSTITLQEALISLGLLQINQGDRCEYTRFAWGSYGPRTAKAVLKLYEVAGITRRNPGYVPYAANPGRENIDYSGNVFGARGLRALRDALQAQAAGQDWRAVLHRNTC